MPRKSGSHGVWHTKRANGTHHEHKGRGGGRRSQTQQPTRGEPASFGTTAATGQKNAQSPGKTNKASSRYAKKQARLRGHKQ